MAVFFFPLVFFNSNRAESGALIFTQELRKIISEIVSGVKTRHKVF